MSNNNIGISLNNLGTLNKNKVIIYNRNKALELYFSYETIVGFRTEKGSYVTNEKFSNTTSRLQNELKDEWFSRVSKQTFKTKLKQELKKVFSNDK